MRKYEIIFITKPTIEADVEKKVLEEMKEILTKNNATITDEKNLGKKELAYEVKEFNIGNYYQLNVETENSLPIKEFDRVALISENIIKHLIVKL